NYVLDNFYKNTPDGLIGNEDCGQMSAWYVLGSLGMYAVTPGNPEWTTIKPYFSKVKVKLEDGTKLKITEDEPASRYAGLKKVQQQKPPYHNIVPVPVIESDKKSFRESGSVTVRAFNVPRQLRYLPMYKVETGDRKDIGFSLYKAPINITSSGKIYAFSVDSEDGMKTSDTIVATYVKKPNDYTISLQSTYNPQYHAGGPEGLLDGIYGTDNWRKGDWQGYQGQDFEAVVDLGKIKAIKNISTDFLQDSRSWILMPAKVEYSSSEDGIHFTQLKSVGNTIDPHLSETVIKDFPADVNAKARYIKVKAYNFGTLPPWHQGAGGQAFIFVDEIRIE
ncbi:MAG: alpha-mannosidase, partial [Chitinophagaceae bacterium]